MFGRIKAVVQGCSVNQSVHHSSLYTAVILKILSLYLFVRTVIGVVFWLIADVAARCYASVYSSRGYLHCC